MPSHTCVSQLDSHVKGTSMKSDGKCEHASHMCEDSSHMCEHTLRIRKEIS